MCVWTHTHTISAWRKHGYISLFAVFLVFDLLSALRSKGQLRFHIIRATWRADNGWEAGGLLHCGKCSVDILAVYKYTSSNNSSLHKCWKHSYWMHFYVIHIYIFFFIWKCLYVCASLLCWNCESKFWNNRSGWDTNKCNEGMSVNALMLLGWKDKKAVFYRLPCWVLFFIFL